MPSGACVDVHEQRNEVGVKATPQKHSAEEPGVKRLEKLIVVEASQDKLIVIEQGMLEVRLSLP